MIRPPLAKWIERQAERARLRLARPDALLLLAALGLVTGLAAGAVILLFRVAVEGTQGLWLPGGLPENYEGLPVWLRLLLPVAGGLAIGLLFRWAARGQYVLGVAKLLERMAYHQGRMDWRGFFLQFLGAAMAIVSGHSVGREGPHIYLGAASGSLLGQHLGLPNNAIRTLVGCGTAAGIAASFNTPLAGVIFSLEVVMLEYSLASFTPVILAAVSATALSVAVLGDRPAFDVPALAMGSLKEIPVVLAVGLAAGVLSALFNHLVENLARVARDIPFWWRTLLAGLLVGLCGAAVPEVMGVGYDTVGQALVGGLSLGILVAALAGKLLATVASIGLGIPGGMIGPVLFLGAMLGSIAGIVSGSLLSGVESLTGFYALIGMGAMMGASLQAPLAALTAMMELTYNPAVIMPGMLAIAAAGLVSRVGFGKTSLFLAMLRANGMDYDAHPVLQALRRVGVASVMNTRFQHLGEPVTREAAQKALASSPDWLVINGTGGPHHLMPAVDLARHLEESSDEVLDVAAIPAKRYQLVPIPIEANLHEALERLNESGAEALYVERMTAPGIRRVFGVLTRGRIESAYKV